MPVRQWVSVVVSDPAAYSVRPPPELLTPVLLIIHRVIAGFLRKQAGPGLAPQGHEVMRGGNQRELWHTVPILFPIPHRPTKLLIEPAACKSLKINKVGSRALASLLITKRGICGNRAGKRAAVEWTRATSLRFSLGEWAKKSQPIRVGTLSIGGAKRNRTRVRFPKRIVIKPVFVLVLVDCPFALESVIG